MTQRDHMSPIHLAKPECDPHVLVGTRATCRTHEGGQLLQRHLGHILKATHTRNLWPSSPPSGVHPPEGPPAVSERTQEPGSSLLNAPAQARGPGRGAWERQATFTGRDTLQARV